MDHAGYWNLILRLHEETKDDSMAALRVALLNDFAMDEKYLDRCNVRHIAICLRSFFTRRTAAERFQVQEYLPLVMFPGSSGSNMLNLLPVAREAQRQGLLGVVVAGDVRREKLAEFDRVLTKESLFRLVGVRRYPGILWNSWRRLKRLVSWLEKHDPSCAHKVTLNWGWYFRLLVDSERARIAFEKMLPVWKPSCVLSTSDFWPFEFQLYRQAIKRGIPTAIIQHGELTGVIEWPTQADTVLLWGEIFKQKLFQRGAPANRLRVCGMPAGDEPYARFRGATANPPAGGSLTCLFLSHAHDRVEAPQQWAEIGAFLKRAINLVPNVSWKIKLHPAENDSFYREIGLTGLASVEILPKGVSLDEAVSQCDVASTVRSTAGLQAMMMQKPLIIVDVDARPETSAWWPQNGGGLYAKNPDEFNHHVNRMFGSGGNAGLVIKSQNEFLESAFANRGRAATSVVDFLGEQTRARWGVPNLN